MSDCEKGAYCAFKVARSCHQKPDGITLREWSARDTMPKADPDSYDD